MLERIPVSSGAHLLRASNMHPPKLPVQTLPAAAGDSSFGQRNAGFRCRLCCMKGGLSVALASGPSSLLKCTNCGVAFIDPLPTPESITEHFRHDYINDEVHVENVYGDLRKGALSLIAGEVRKRRASGRILDVGCAGGYFLDRYFPSSLWEKFGIEPSRYALRRATARQIQTYEGEVRSVDLPDGYFDVITVAGVLPYFRDPKRELHILKRALKPGGLILIELPLAATQIWRHTTSLGRMTGGGSRSIFESPHLFFYDSKSLQLLVSEAGLTLEGLAPSPGNRQAQIVHETLFRSYFWMSRALSFLSGERWLLGPGVIITALRPE
jgi:SAM-dependent methyltransferase